MIKKEKSISQEIESSIRRRVLAAFAILVALVLVVSAYEIYFSIEKLSKKLAQESETLSYAIVSEILVANEGSIKNRLDAAKETNPHISKVEWKKTVSRPRKQGLSWEFPLSFTYTHVVSYQDMGRFGYLLFHGNIAKDKTFLNPVMLRFTLIGIFAMFVISILMPLSRSIPEKFVRGPIHNLVKLFQDQLPVDSADELIAYTEIRPAIEDLRRYLESKKLMDESREHMQRVEAIADAVQMLAHDVRRPFSMLLAGIKQIEDVQDPAKMQAVIQKVTSLTKDATKNVDRLVAGVMDLQSNHAPQQSKVNLVELIRSSLIEVFGVKSKGDSSFRYDFGHTHLADVDEAKVGRVLANLIENAFDAQNGCGSIWLQTRQAGERIEIIVGNDGSFIDELSRKKIFDRFYTKGKSNGTGLGLAIAKKVIEDHGGEILCESDKQTGTVFRFTVPSSGELALVNTVELPKSCLEIRENFSTLASLAQSSKVKKVALVEDDEIFVEEWRLSSPNNLIVHFARPDDFISTLQIDRNIIDSFDAVVTDFRFRNSQLNGDDLAFFMRNNFPNVPVILSSNSSKREYNKSLYSRVLTKGDTPEISTFAFVKKDFRNRNAGTDAKLN